MPGTLAMRPTLPSFQTFLDSARHHADERRPQHQHQHQHQHHALVPLLHAVHQRVERAHQLHHRAPRMHQLAALTAREYARACARERSSSASPTTSSEGAVYPSWATASSSASVSASPSPSSDESESSEEERRQRRAMAAAMTAHGSPTPHRNKKKYLKEKQRCEIVRRVRAGERQAHLAKEFGVSRAAVCYLLKHQMEILGRAESP